MYEKAYENRKTPLANSIKLADPIETQNSKCLILKFFEVLDSVEVHIIERLKQEHQKSATSSCSENDYLTCCQLM